MITAGRGMDVKLEHFQGPLDLLLHLVEKSEIDIADIFISDITAQYMSLMQQASNLDMEKASSFLQMAAHLLYIKSRALLPRIRFREEGEEEMDPEALLIQQIHEYKACKQAAEQLIVMRESAAHCYVRLPDEYPLPPPKLLLTDLPPDALYQAFLGLLLREGAEKTNEEGQHIQKDAYNIGDQMREIRKGIRSRERQPLGAFFPKGGGRLGIIVTFIALLELLNQKLVRINQDEDFGTIWVQASTDAA